MGISTMNGDEELTVHVCRLQSALRMVMEVEESGRTADRESASSADDGAFGGPDFRGSQICKFGSSFGFWAEA